MRPGMVALVPDAFAREAGLMPRRRPDGSDGRGRRARGLRRAAPPDVGETLGEGLLALLAAMGGTPGRAGLQNLWDNWEEALGRELAELARPLGHREGRQKAGAKDAASEGKGAVLLLGAEDAMLLQELRFRGGEILARVNGFLGQLYFSEVQVSLPLGRDEPVRSRLHEKMAAKEEAEPPAQGPSGIFLEAMDRASPVARCYACYAGLSEGGRGQEREGRGMEEKGINKSRLRND